MNSEEFANIEMKKLLDGLKCPLPRIGSKDWGWRKEQHCRAYFASSKTELVVEHYADKTWAIRADRMSAGWIAVIRGLQPAIRFAELLARRDWRRENRGKK